MESLSYQQLQVVEDLLEQIHHAILELKEWNKGVDNPDAWLMSADGMKTLAANCMMIEAIGEGLIFYSTSILTYNHLIYKVCVATTQYQIIWRHVRI